MFALWLVLVDAFAAKLSKIIILEYILQRFFSSELTETRVSWRKQWPMGAKWQGHGGPLAESGLYCAKTKPDPN